LSPELKIILYLFSVLCLFFIDGLLLYGVIFIILCILLFVALPVRFIARGWIPITMLLIFTFISNILFRHGKVLCTAGPLMITHEGLTDAAEKTMRIFFMVAGAKLLTGSASVESLALAFGRILRPLEHVGVPVNEFVSTMRLTVRSLPALREQFLSVYRERIENENIRGIWNRARVVAGFLMPLIVLSIRKPEYFHERTGEDQT
jgi:energy-coupling factor transport system permease protein